MEDQDWLAGCSNRLSLNSRFQPKVCQSSPRPNPYRRLAQNGRRQSGLFQEFAGDLWSKYRIDLSQEFVVGGYIPSNLGIDSLVVGVYRGKDLVYAARVRAGLVPATRRELFERLKAFENPEVPARQPPRTSGLIAEVRVSPRRK
jgi:hypothetical protein